MNRWLVCYAERVRGNQEFRNIILEQDPIMWIVKRNLIHAPVVLVSCFSLENVEDDLFENIINTINTQEASQ